MSFTALQKVLERNGFAVTVCATGAEAAAYLNRVIDGVSVGCGVSMTLEELRLYDSLAGHNTLIYHRRSEDVEAARRAAMSTEVYLLSANGIAEDTGEIISIDGVGNRAASALLPTGRSTLWPGGTRFHRTTSRPCTGCAMWWPLKMPGAWGSGPPAPPEPTAATTATAPSGSAGAWWCTISG